MGIVSHAIPSRGRGKKYHRDTGKNLDEWVLPCLLTWECSTSWLIIFLHNYLLSSELKSTLLPSSCQSLVKLGRLFCCWSLIFLYMRLAANVVKGKEKVEYFLPFKGETFIVILLVKKKKAYYFIYCECHTQCQVIKKTLDSKEPIHSVPYHLSQHGLFSKSRNLVWFWNLFHQHLQ